MVVRLQNNSGMPDQDVQLYSGSYALLVGGSNYYNGWAALESVPRELEAVADLLQERGFVVEKHVDLESKQLRQIFEGFIRKYGYKENNRLLFFYSGHGYTRKDGKKGYLVPVDAPNPNRDELGFLSKALSMNQILFWARDIEAKHALFLFDSCFSGTIFKQRDLPKPPKYITRMTTLPVRQFITAGMAGESVPAVSTFTPAFIDGLLYSLADLNGDGYVSGTELGLYLQEKVPQYTNQTPQFGKIADYELSRGDFIFIAGGVTEHGDKRVGQSEAGVSQFGELKVISTPAGAEVFFNGKPVGVTPLQFGSMPAGAVVVHISKKGFSTQKQTVDIAKGRRTVLRFDLQQRIIDGYLEVKTVPHTAHVKFADNDLQYSPEMELPPGVYDIEVSADQFQTARRQVKIVSGEKRVVIVTLEKMITGNDTERVALQKVETPDPPKKIREIGRKGRFIFYEDATIKDTETGLMWPNEDNRKDISWLNARKYCENYRQGGYYDWRMPTVEELQKLHAAMSGLKKPPVVLSKSYVWSSKVNGEKAAFLYFEGGHQLWFEKSHTHYLRALPVRSSQ